MNRGIPCAVLVGLALGVAAGRAGEADPSGLTAREVAFESSGLRLVGTLTGPAGGAGVASVLIIPGSGPVDRDGASRSAPMLSPVYRQWAERLGHAGLVVLRYDKRFLTHPGLDVAALDQEAQIADALAAVAFLRAVPELAARRVFVLGHSEGGTLAPIVAERAGGIAGIAIVNTVQFPVDELLVAQLRARPGMPESAVAEVEGLLARVKDGTFPRGRLLLGAGRDYWAQWIRYSRTSAERLSRVATPLLLVQGLSDETLPGRTLARNVEILRSIASTSRTAELHELPGQDHFGRPPGAREPAPELLRVLADWVRRHAAPLP